MRFFSKFVFICNLCFIAVVIFRWIEVSGTGIDRSGEAPLRLQPLVSTLAVLGYGAIIFNLLFNAVCLSFRLLKKPILVARWLIWTNFLLLVIQFYFFKLY